MQPLSTHITPEQRSALPKRLRKAQRPKTPKQRPTGVERYRTGGFWVHPDSK